MSMKVEKLQTAINRFIPHLELLVILMNQKNTLQRFTVGYNVAEIYRIYLPVCYYFWTT